MNAQVAHRKFGLAAAGFTLFLFGYQLIAFLLVGVLNSTDMIDDDTAALTYALFTLFGWFLGIITVVVGCLGMAKDQVDRWIGAVAIVLCLALLGLSTAVAILATLDFVGN